MDFTLTEFIDNRLDEYFPDRSLYNVSPFSVEDLRDCILMEIIKDAYFEAGEKKSLRANRGSDDDDLRMRDSRWMSYDQHYRSLQYERVKESLNVEIKELLPPNVESMPKKLDGYKITEMQYFELNTMANIPILKSITNKRICDVKKISNDEFIKGMEEYDKLVADLIGLLDDDDEDVIFATIALFTLEWKYNIELYYNCAVKADKHKIKDVPVHKLAVLCAVLSMPVPFDFDQYLRPTMLHTESRFVLHRLDLVPYLYSKSDKAWEEVNDKLWHYFIAKYHITQEIIHKWSMAEFFATHIPREKWAEFFREHYDLRKMYKRKIWTNKRIRYVRKLIDVMVRNEPAPKL